MNEILIAIIGSGALSTIITLISSRLSRKDNVEEGVVQLLGINIRERCEKAIDNQKIGVEELSQLQSMNTTYKKMGGNGFVRVLMDKVEHLEVFIEE